MTSGGADEAVACPTSRLPLRLSPLHYSTWPDGAGVRRQSQPPSQGGTELRSLGVAASPGPGTLLLVV